jgi:hypothetical protein
MPFLLDTATLNILSFISAFPRWSDGMHTTWRTPRVNGPRQLKQGGSTAKSAAKVKAKEGPLEEKGWRDAGILARLQPAVGMIYLRDNPLLKKTAQVEHTKARLLGHWGASPALSFVWVH